MQFSDAAAQAALGEARARVRRMSADLADLRRRAGTLDDDTRWSALSAQQYRRRLTEWREALTARAAELDALDDELRLAAARVQAQAMTGGLP